MAEQIIEQLSMYEKVTAGIVMILIVIFSIWVIQLIRFGFEKLSGRNMWAWVRVVLTLLLSAGLAALGADLWVNRYTKANEDAKEYLISNQAVVIHPLDYGYFFDSWGTENAMIFYGEELIDETAYAPLLERCAVQGLDCFLITQPYHRVSLNPNGPDQILAAHSYYGWYMGAHGSAAPYALAYCNDHPQVFDGLILFGAYPEEKLHKNMNLIAVYASEDGLFDTEGYEKAKKNFPENTREATIQGANHSGFADCGLMQGDREALISSDLQQQKAAEMVRMALIGIR